MLRVQSRELVAALAAALAPGAWAWWPGAPSVLDAERGAAGVVALRELGVGEATGVAEAALLVAFWMAGYLGWRCARERAPEAGWGAAACFAAAAQLGPWSLWLLAHADPGLFAIGPVLVAGGLVAHRRAAALLLVAAVLAAGGAYAARLVPPPAVGSTPMYAGASGAWFPLPPAEAAPWRAAAAAYGGRWVHPLSVAVSGDGSRGMPALALPLAVEAAVVPAPPFDLDVWALAITPSATHAVLRSVGVAALTAPIAALVLAVAAGLLRGGGRRARLVVAALAVVSIVGDAAVRRGCYRPPTPALLPGAALAAAPPAPLHFPSPYAPWSSGRWSVMQLGAVGAEAPPAAAAPLIVEMARLSGEGLDVAAAGPAWEAGRIALSAGLAAVPGGVLVDSAALPGWGWARLYAALQEAGATVDGEGPLVLVRPPPEPARPSSPP
ncbi:MAG: hypothetical protein EXR71_14265 [Myxococcales bacterium]|nr:hypothetical protein [Myxococcales bacterium]